MSRRWAVRTLWILVLLIAVDVVDLFVPAIPSLPDPAVKVVLAVFAGVAIGSILAGLVDEP